MSWNLKDNIDKNYPDINRKFKSPITQIFMISENKQSRKSGWNSENARWNQWIEL